MHDMDRWRGLVSHALKFGILFAYVSKKDKAY